MSGPRVPGQLAILLHTHMPYVEGFGTWPFGEEWLWHGVAESHYRVADAVAGHPVTVGITPVLADQFEAMKGHAGDRMLGYFNDSREYVFGEDMAAFHQVGRGDLKISLEPQLQDFRSASARFENDRDLNGMFDELAAGGVELLGGPATHPAMPLLASDFGADLQLQTGLASHKARFGETKGIWLPECAYDRGVDQALARNGVEYFCVDQSEAFGLQSHKNLEPIKTAAGPVAVPIDWYTVGHVWRADGFPGAGAYRNSFDRTIHSLMPRDNDGKAWNIGAAKAQAHAHAASFLRSVAARLEVYEGDTGKAGLCVFAVDTELLGHWWYEGPWWLEEVIKQAAGAGIELTTLSEGIARTEPVEREITRSSWGANKNLDTWDSPPVAAIAWQQRAAELELLDALGHASSYGPAEVRAARELLALQSSDWAFISKRETAGEYANDRFTGHVAGFERALSSVRQSAGNDANHIAAVAGLAPGLTGENLKAVRDSPA